MRQKLALACTLIHTPELLVLDEPTTGVDPVSRRDFWRILAELQRDGLTLLVTTPYLDEAERCQRVALMHRGRILTLDTPEALESQADGVIVEILAEPKRAAVELLAARPEVADVQAFGERLHATLRGTDPSAGAEAGLRLSMALEAAGLKVVAARAVSPSLEDVFIARIRAFEDEAAPAEVRP
jgi:ABC-2 type transport system ATP-binding protein